jgi:hypothetical protein
MDNGLLYQQSLRDVFFPASITLRFTKVFSSHGRTNSTDRFQKAFVAMLLRIEGQAERCGKRVMAQHFQQITWIDQFDGCAV